MIEAGSPLYASGNGEWGTPNWLFEERMLTGIDDTTIIIYRLVREKGPPGDVEATEVVAPYDYIREYPRESLRLLAKVTVNTPYGDDLNEILEASRAIVSNIEQDENYKKLQNIYRRQVFPPIAGQVAEVVLLRSNTNTEPPVSTLTRKSFMKINRIKENEPDEDLVSYTVIGTLSRPTIFTEST